MQIMTKTYDKSTNKQLVIPCGKCENVFVYLYKDFSFESLTKLFLTLFNDGWSWNKNGDNQWLCYDHDHEESKE